MKYVPPFGRETEGESASYINGDPTVGRQGSIPPAAVFENPQREIVAVITKSAFTPTDIDLLQLAKSVRSQRLNYVEDTGSDSNLSVALDPPLTSYTNSSDSVRINAGAGNVPVRKMNGADVGAGLLPAGALATLIYDGTNFQLSNFGGAPVAAPGEEVAAEVYQVKIPYAVDTSPIPGEVRVGFNPPITELGAGDIMAVKVANSNPGPISLFIDAMSMQKMLPNGGGGAIALQGDVRAGDIVILFYDGSDFWFTPNPEITAPVTYSIGPSQNFESIDAAMVALRRKAIGGDGHVTLQLVPGVYNGPIAVAHPSLDRITVAGTMIGAAPAWNNFFATGNSSSSRSQDAANNIAMLRGRYGTEIVCPDFTGSAQVQGLVIESAGSPTFRDLLITGLRKPLSGSGVYNQSSITLFQGYACTLINVAAWGLTAGFIAQTNSAMKLENCFACACTGIGFYAQTGAMGVESCGAFGNQLTGMYANSGGIISGHYNVAMCNADYGFVANNSATMWMHYARVVSNAPRDLLAGGSALLGLQSPLAYGSSSPAIGVSGNGGGRITVY
jgi:hypothetical protein